MKNKPIPREQNGQDKFVSVVCQSHYNCKVCKRACMFVFPDTKEMKDHFRESLKYLIENCPVKKAKFK